MTTNNDRLIKIREGSSIDCTSSRAKRTRENLTRWEFEAEKRELLLERLRIQRRLEQQS